MIAAARARAERENVPATFVRADAQTYAFEPASFDTIISRFGVMFFDDSVRAFTNLRRSRERTAPLRADRLARRRRESVHDGGRARGGAAAAESSRSRKLDEPGQFRSQIRIACAGILERERDGRRSSVRPLDVACTWPGEGPGSVPDAARSASASRFRTRTPGLARGSSMRARAAFEPYVHAAEVRFTAACWMINAQGGHDRIPRVGSPDFGVQTSD